MISCKEDSQPHGTEQLRVRVRARLNTQLANSKLPA